MKRDFDKLKDDFHYARYEEYNPKTYDGITQNLWDLPAEEWNPKIVKLLLNLNKRVNDLEFELKEMKEK